MAWASRSRNFNPFSWWGALLVSIAAGLFVGGLVALFWPSTYKASSSFFVSDPAELLSTMLKSSVAVPGATDDSKLKPTQERLAAILSSRMLRAKLVQKHDLARRLGLDSVEAEEALARMAKINPIGTEGFSIEVTCKGYTHLRAAVTRSLVHTEARDLCAALANDYLSELQKYVTDTSVKEAQKRRQFIEDAERHVLSQLGQAQSGIERLQRANALLDPESKAALITDRVRALQQSDSEARAKIAETQSSLSKAEGQLAHTDTMRIASVVEMRNPIIGQVEQKIADLQVQLATEEAKGKTRQHRDVIQIQTALDTAQCQLAQLKEDVHKEIARSANPEYEKMVGEVVDLRVTLAGARARAARTASMLAAARGDLTELPPLQRQYATLKQDQEIQFQALAALKQSMAIALVQEQQSKRVGEFLKLDEAVPPANLHPPPVLWSMLLVTGALLAIIGLMGLNRMIFGG